MFSDSRTFYELCSFAYHMIIITLLTIERDKFSYFAQFIVWRLILLRYPQVNTKATSVKLLLPHGLPADLAYDVRTR